MANGVLRGGIAYCVLRRGIRYSVLRIAYCGAMADGGWRIAYCGGELRMADGGWRMARPNLVRKEN